MDGKLMRSLLSLGMLLVVAAPLVAQDNTQTTGAGKIEVVDTYDWGTVPPGTLKAQVEIKNVGKSPLNITKIQPSCGCTTAPLDKDVLQPGESAKMDVSVNVRHTGALRKNITIYSNDPENPTKLLQLVANVEEDLAFTPNNDYLVVTNPTVGTAVQTSVRLKNMGKSEVTIYAPKLDTVESMDMSFSMTKEQKLAPGEELDVTVSVTPHQAGSLRGVFTVKSTSRDNPERTFTVYANAVDPAATKDNAMAPGKTRDQK